MITLFVAYWTLQPITGKYHMNMVRSCECLRVLMKSEKDKNPNVNYISYIVITLHHDHLILLTELHSGRMTLQN